MTTADSVRTQILNELTRVAGQVPGVLGSTYDSPIDLTRRDLPWAYVYDGDEQYDYEYVNRRSATLQVGIAIAFRFKPEQVISGPMTSNETLRRAGNAILAAAIMRFAEHQQNADDRKTELYYEALPKASTILEVNEGDENAGAAILELDVTYMTELSNPYTQMVA